MEHKITHQKHYLKEKMQTAFEKKIPDEEKFVKSTILCVRLVSEPVTNLLQS